MSKTWHNLPEKGLNKGDNVIEIHIPADGPLLKSECENSIETAREFFKKYSPEFEYKFFTSNTWLLDESLKEILGVKSNILDFQSLFEICASATSNGIIKYVFGWDTTERKLAKKPAESSFAKKVKERIIAGGHFNTGFGMIAK